MAKNDFINLYYDNPTSGRQDGTMLDDTVNILEITVNSTKEERKVVKLAIRTEPGYITNSDTTIWFRGANSDKWSICKTEDGVFGSALVISELIGSQNVIFYVKGAATSGELPDIDKTVSIKVSTTVESLES